MKKTLMLKKLFVLSIVMLIGVASFSFACGAGATSPSSEEGSGFLEEKESK